MVDYEEVLREILLSNVPSEKLAEILHREYLIGSQDGYADCHEKWIAEKD